ncbi:MAG: hypothetical protein QME81_00720 [bacterium]|nr:hypothetical protein [bacterium]
MRERALRNKVSELAAAREEGIEEGREEGREEGLKQGEIIGQIRLLQEMLKHLICSEKDLVQKSIEELNKMLQELKAELKS